MDALVIAVLLAVCLLVGGLVVLASRPRRRPSARPLTGRSRSSDGDSEFDIEIASSRGGSSNSDEPGVFDFLGSWMNRNSDERSTGGDEGRTQGDSSSTDDSGRSYSSDSSSSASSYSTDYGSSSSSDYSSSSSYSSSSDSSSSSSYGSDYSSSSSSYSSSDSSSYSGGGSSSDW